MIDINNLDRDAILRLLDEVEKNNNYIIDNFPLEDRIKLFINILTNEEIVDLFDDDDEVTKLSLNILTYDEIDKLKETDEFKDNPEIYEFKILLGDSEQIVGKLLSKETDNTVNIYIVCMLPVDKKIKILNNIKEGIYKVLIDTTNTNVLDELLYINDGEEFYSIIRKLGSKNIQSILDNYPNLILYSRVLDELDDDYKIELLDKVKTYNYYSVVSSIKDKDKKYELGIKLLEKDKFANLIKSEESEDFKYQLMLKFHDKLRGSDFEEIIDTFNKSENIYNSLVFLAKNNIRLDNYHLAKFLEKLEPEYLVDAIDLFINNIYSGDLLKLLNKLGTNKKYEYILKYKEKLSYDSRNIIEILREDLLSKKIEENEFVNILIELFKNKFMGSEFIYLVSLVGDENKLRMLNELGEGLSRDVIIDTINEMNLSPKERLDLNRKYEIYGIKEINFLISELPVELRLEYLKNAISEKSYYNISLEELTLILSGADPITKINILDTLNLKSLLKREYILNIELNIDMLLDSEILKLLDIIKTTNIQFIVATYLKDDALKLKLYKEMYIADYNELVDKALSSLKDDNIKFEYLIYLSNYRGSLEYTLDILKYINLDIGFFEKFVNEKKNSREYDIIIKAIMISKFDDKLKIKYFNQLNIKNSGIYFKLLLESLKFDDSSLDYSVFKKTIREIFYNKQFNLFNNIDNNILKHYFDDIELYFLEERKKLKESDKKILDDHIDFSNLTKERINHIISIINKINNSNCLEIIRLEAELKTILIQEENPLEKLKALEKIFLRNNLPLGVKLYEVFEVLHPNFNNFSGTVYSKVLTNEEISLDYKFAVLLEDMIKITFQSSPKQALDYLDEMKNQIALLKKVLYIKNKSIKYEELDEQSKIVVNNILNIVNSWSFIFKFQKETDLRVVYEYINENMIDGIEDWIVNIISNSLGIDLKNLDDVREYVISNSNRSNERNKNYRDFTLKEGDLVKGVANYEKFLFTMLQNGINCQEFLGANAGGDCTNLDTDFSMISSDKDSIEDSMIGTTAAGFGQLWIVVKNRAGRFNTTGDMLDKRMELFKINGDGGDNYGIRSGVPVTEIDYIICNNWDERIGFAIACSGIYIPVVNKQGELLFSYADFEKMRSKMQGLSYYGYSEYRVSDTMYKGDLATLEYLEKDAEEINRKREIIYKELDSTINYLGYNVLHRLDADFTTDNMELIDTGSTSRGNNKPNDADFDFMLRMDSDIYKDEKSRRNFVNCIENKLKELGGIPNVGNNPPERLRYTDVHFEGIEEAIEVDISFIQRTNKVNYTTDMCLIDRMDNIKKQYPELYNSVRLNVIIAKSILKKAGIYKRLDKCLGGVGTENWILQNGGSVIDAVDSFLSVANNCSSFDEFKLKYSIFDFGSNFYDSSKTDGHDNFIYNLSNENYEKMKETLIKFKNEYEEAFSKGTLDQYISSIIEFESIILSNSKKI